MNTQDHFIPATPKFTPEQQQQRREKLNRDIEEYLKRGGKIQEL